MALLDVRNLTVEYHTEAGIFRAVEDLTFQLEAGHTLGLVGEAGRIVDGEVLYGGKDLLRISVQELRDIRWHRISMIFQGAMNALNPTRTIGSQIAEAMQIHNLGSMKDVQAEISRLLDLVGIAPQRASQYPHEYSGGMRQRAMIAMALACKPDLVIADEPTTALDVMVQAQILDLLQNLQHEMDISVIFVTHDLGVVAELCDDVMVMYGGWLAEHASADTIFNHPMHPYTQRLMGAFPDIDNPRAELASIPGHPPPLNNLPAGCRFEPRCHKAIEACATTIPGVCRLAPNHVARCLRLEAYDQ